MRYHPWLLAVVLAPFAGLSAWGADAAVITLLSSKRCPRCNLSNADLVHARLNQAQLPGADLQGSNLSRAELNSADLRGANLSFASLQGASLRGADLRGANLNGTDLRQSDLSGAQLDPGAIERSHWQGARGLNTLAMGYATVHNAGVEASERGDFPAAEQFFNTAIRLNPEAGVSWMARGLSRQEQGKQALAVQDLLYAAALYNAAGDQATAQQLEQAATALAQPEAKPKGGSGMGIQLAGGLMGALQYLAPLAAKALVPMPF